jgi:hypothetical protein
MTIVAAVPTCAEEASDHGLPDAGSSRRPGWVAIAGRLSAPAPGWAGGGGLRIRYERSSERFYALAMLACSVICFNTLQQPPG